MLCIYEYNPIHTFGKKMMLSLFEEIICEKINVQSFPKSQPAALLLPGNLCCTGSSKGRV